MKYPPEGPIRPKGFGAIGVNPVGKGRKPIWFFAFSRQTDQEAVSSLGIYRQKRTSHRLRADPDHYTPGGRLSAKIRKKSGLTSDVGELAMEAFGLGKAGFPTISPKRPKALKPDLRTLYI